ncbi:MAG TPA: alpha/beta hydrolase [Xenococcaceae cyanobacterium]
MVLGLVIAFDATNVKAADKIAFNYPPFGEFYIYIEDLASFVEQDKINSRLNYFIKNLNTEQIDRLQSILGQEIALNPVTVYRFTNSSVGKITLQQLTKIIKSDSIKNLEIDAEISQDLLALRGAINQAANHPDGFTLLNVLRQFPLPTIYLDLSETLSLIETGERLLEQRELIINFVQSEANIKERTITAKESNLSLPGNYQWERLSLAFDNPQRINSSFFELYLPKTAQPVPLIIISHGLASDRNTFDYLGKHFASYGFAVAIPDHNTTNFEQFARFLSGKAKLPQAENLILQPLDIKYLLDWLESESQTNQRLKHKINLQQVGLIGHSLGGYTALALAGGEFNWKKTQQQCLVNQEQNFWLNLSLFIQCLLPELSNKNYQLVDSRIKAVIAISPFASVIFGQEGMAQVSVPTMMISGTKDPITPAVPEQIYPFTWLKIPNKYLLLVAPANHFSFLEEGVGILPVPDSLVGLKPSVVYPGLKHFTTAFFQVHLNRQSEAKIYLQQGYANYFANPEIKLDLIRFIDNFQLQ